MNPRNPRMITILLTFLLVSFAGGCSVHSVHDRAYVSESISERAGHAIRNEKEVGTIKLPEGISPEDGLAADEAIAIALWNNARFQSDLVQLGFARADLIEAGMLRNPILSLLFPLGPKQLEATLNLPIDFFWQRPKRIAAAKLNARLVADSLIQNGLDLVRDVLLAYAELELMRTLEKISSEEAVIHEEIATIATARFKIGDISQLEEGALHLQAAETRDSALRFERDAAIAEERLKNLLGLGSSEASLELTDPPDMNGIQLRSLNLLDKALAARPDLRAAEIAMEAAGERLGWERAKIFNLTAMLDANGEGKEGFEMGPGFQLEIPLFNQNNGKISRARAELELAAREYVAVRQRIATEVGEASLLYRAARDASVLIKDNMIPLAAAAAENAAEAYAIGDISYLELLESKRRLLTTRMREARAAAELWQAEARLKHSIGFTPLDPGK